MLKFGTFATELKGALRVRLTNQQFINLLYAALVAPGTGVQVTKNAASKLMNCSRLVDPCVQQAAEAPDAEKKAQRYFSETVIPQIDPDRVDRLIMQYHKDIVRSARYGAANVRDMLQYASNDTLDLFLAKLYVYVVRARNIDDTLRYIGWDPEPDEDDGYEMPDYSEYIDKLERRYSTLKTLLYNDGNKPFYSFYVCNNVSVSFHHLMQMDERAIYRMHGIDREVADATPEKLRRYSKRLILTGTGGLGKSMMMRHLLLNASKAYNTEKRLPVFIPLKDYDSASGLLTHIYHCVQNICDTISQEQLCEALEHGKVLLLLDGLDEIRPEMTEQYTEELLKLVEQYPRNMVIMSSRPYDAFAAFSGFLVLRLHPFTQHQAIQLIDKLEFRPDEPQIKQKFKALLKGKLFDSHQEFAENPLLLTIMLMTFEQFAEVPSKMYVFYREAYITLSQKHDASKGAYKRTLRTGMTAERFSDYFAEFCARTYRDSKFEMSADEIQQYFDALKERQRGQDPSMTADDFIYDLRHNLCLLYHEGGKYHFSHRSFQEYFCALYFSKQKDRTLKGIGDFFETREVSMHDDKTFGMLYDMIPEKVEEYIFEPKLRELFDVCDAGNGYQTYLMTMHPQISNMYPGFDPNSMVMVEWTSFICEFIVFTCLQKRKRSKSKRPTLPVYEEFVVGEYQLWKHNEDDTVIPLPKDRDLPSERFKTNFTPMNETVYDLNVDIARVYSDPERYKDMIDTLSDPEFPTYRFYVRLREYYEDLKRRIAPKGEDLFDLF